MSDWRSESIGSSPVISTNKYKMAKEEKRSLSKEQEKNKNISVQILNSYRGALEKVRQYFDSVKDMDMDDSDETDKYQKTMAFILKCGADLGKNIETLAVLEKKVQAEEATNSKIRGGSKLSLLEEGEI